VTVTSDGHQGHWQPCVDWAGQVLGREIPMPSGILPQDVEDELSGP
jgi:hypothetical protein